MMEKLRLGLAFTGSYCTYDEMMKVAEGLCEKYDVTVIMSENSASTDSRFGNAEEFKNDLERFSGKPVIHSIAAAEPIGPGQLLDAMVISPCTGNTLAKLATGVTDSCVTMAAKAHLRNARPLIIAISTNDALMGNAANIGTLLARKNIYFVPFRQDDPEKKPASAVADFELIEETIEAALIGRQLQPVIRG